MDFVATVLPRLALGLLISSVIGLVAYRRGSLSRSGVLGAVLTGTTIFGFGGFTAGVLLVAFFVSSSLLSHFKQNSAQKQRAAEMFDKGGQRDIWQALANGGAAAGFAITSHLFSLQIFDLVPGGVTYQLDPILYAAMLGALATVTSDTWATELGILSSSKPRLVTSLKQVDAGTSGAITLVGTMMAFCGAVFIYTVFVVVELILGQTILSPPRFVWLVSGGVIASGLIGSLFDSFLGATAQAIYYSDARQKETEKAIEKDGTKNKHLRGWRWLNNDWVNFISSVVGALVAAGLVVLIL